jgi:hypothetical protein
MDSIDQQKIPQIAKTAAATLWVPLIKHARPRGAVPASPTSAGTNASTAILDSSTSLPDVLLVNAIIWEQWGTFATGKVVSVFAGVALAERTVRTAVLAPTC